MQHIMVARNGGINKETAHILISSPWPLVSSNTSSPLRLVKGKFRRIGFYCNIFDVLGTFRGPFHF